MRADDRPELAHLYGVGASHTEALAVSRRAVEQLAATDPGELMRAILARAIKQALLEALPVYWVRRAEELEKIGTQWGWEAAVACRRHAWLLSQGLPDDLAGEVEAILAEEVA